MERKAIYSFLLLFEFKLHKKLKYQKDLNKNNPT
jgi:hypothetical protein